MKLKYVIIEDEPFARKELIRLLKKALPEGKVIAELDSVEDSIAFFKASNAANFDLIFCDIQLSDGISFDIFKQVSVETPIIFTTAYNEYAIKAFDQNSIAYLLKTIEEEPLQKALSKFNRVVKKQEAASSGIGLTETQLQAIQNLAKPQPKNRFIAKVGDQIKMIHVEEVAYFFAEDKVVFIVRKDGKKFIVDYSLEQITTQVDAHQFFRINRSFLVRIEAISEVHKHFNSRLKLNLAPPPKEEVMVSRNRVNDFLNWLEQ